MKKDVNGNDIADKPPKVIDSYMVPTKKYKEEYVKIDWSNGGSRVPYHEAKKNGEPGKD